MRTMAETFFGNMDGYEHPNDPIPENAIPVYEERSKVGYLFVDNSFISFEGEDNELQVFSSLDMLRSVLFPNDEYNMYEVVNGEGDVLEIFFTTNEYIYIP